MYGKVKIHLLLGRLEFNHQVLASDIVDEAILGVDVMNAYGFTVDFKNNVLRIGGEEEEEQGTKTRRSAPQNKIRNDGRRFKIF